MRQPTEQEATDLWAAMQSYFGTTTASKGDPLWEEVSKLLEKMGIIDAEAFTERFATTIGHTIALPTSWASTSPMEKIILCVHEHQHVVEYNKAQFMYMVNYVVHPSHRAHQEAIAYSTKLELLALRGTKRFGTPINSIMSSLESYGLDANSKALARSHLISMARHLRSGGKPLNETTQVAEAWLRQHAVGVLV